MAAYQDIAENGKEACQGDEKTVKCPDSMNNTSLDEYAPADGLILLDSSLGFGVHTLVSVDPAVVNEDKAMLLNSQLDMYNPENGYVPWHSEYDTDFIARFIDAQRKRMSKLIDNALNRLAALNAENGNYDDDEPFDIPGSNLVNYQIWSLDTNIWSRTHDEHTLVHPDGTTDTVIVHSLRGRAPWGPDDTGSPTSKTEGGHMTTVKRFLNTWACRTTEGYDYGADYVTGIDYQSAYNNPVANVEGIDVPILIVGMSAGQLLVSCETIYNHAVSADKELVFIEGATHMTTPINKDLYGNTTTTTVNYIDGWLCTPRF